MLFVIVTRFGSHVSCDFGLTIFSLSPSLILLFVLEPYKIWIFLSLKYLLREFSLLMSLRKTQVSHWIMTEP